MEFSFLGELSL